MDDVWPGQVGVILTPLGNGDMVANAAETASADEVVDDGGSPVPLAGEPAARLGRGRQHGGPDRDDQQIAERLGGSRDGGYSGSDPRQVS